MTTAPVRPYRSQAAAGRESFWHLVHAEWIKFRTVRGWMIAMIVAIMAVTAFVFLATNVSSSCSGSACPAPPAGPGGEPVQDAFYFAHQPLTGNGTITVQLTSLTGQVAVGPSQTVPGLQPWSKAGIIVKQNTSQGSAYAAMMVTGSNGVRMQWDYVNDTPGLTGSVSAASPRWLRLVRTGDTITGYDSADGTHWTLAGTATLPGLTSTMQAGLFAAAPSNGNTATATGVFRHIGLSWTATRWTGTNVGGSGPNGVPQPGTLRQSAGTITVTGSGDITTLAGDGAVISIQRALAGTPIGLIPLIVVGAMFITAEYRRGLIRVSLTASPSRGRLLAAKAVVIGAISFVTGAIAAALAAAVGARILARTGVPIWPVPTLTLARLILGTGALLAVAAVLALAVGTAVRRSATAVAAAIVVIFVPYLLVLVPPVLPGQAGRGGFSGGGLSLVAREWLLRITPAAGFSVQQVVPQLSQVAGASYSPNWGYYPLAPWAGFAVECAWAAAALALAFYLLRRRDA
jgi:ABC-type transport system involved in multi-copper enzyme maturation permease subunit